MFSVLVLKSDVLFPLSPQVKVTFQKDTPSSHCGFPHLASDASLSGNPRVISVKFIIVILRQQIAGYK